MSRPRRSTKGKSKGSSRSRAAAPARKAPEIDPVEFWGETDQLPDPPAPLAAAADPKAVVQSLGRVPLPGHETAAEHWLALVYERAAVLGSALAAAGELSAEEPSD